MDRSYQHRRGGQGSSQQAVQMRSGGLQADLRPGSGPDVQQVHPGACGSRFKGAVHLKMNKLRPLQGPPEDHVISSRAFVT